MNLSPFRSKSVKARREKPRRVIGRERLHGEAKTQRRREIFERSGGFCEDLRDGKRCYAPITWNTMHWSHNQHAAFKDDSLDAGIASCYDCHMVEKHAGGKPVPKRPGRVMSRTEAQRYLDRTACFCDQAKRPKTAFCNGCMDKLSPQSRMDLAELTNKEWLKCVADCEMELMEAERMSA